MFLITKLTVDENSTTTVEGTGGKEATPAGVVKYAKFIKGGKVIVTIPHAAAEEVETAFRGTTYAFAPDAEIADETYRDYYFDSPTAADAEPAEPDADADATEPAPEIVEDPQAARQAELTGMALVPLRKIAAGHGVDTAGLRKEGLIEAILTAESVEADPDAPTEPVEPEPVAAPPAKPAKAPKAKAAAKAKTAEPAAAEPTYKELQTQASALGHKSVGKTREQLVALIESGPAEPAEKAGKAPAVPKPPKAPKPPKEPSPRVVENGKAEPIINKIRPLLGELMEAYGGSERKVRFALSAVISEVDPSERGNNPIGFPAGKILKVTKQHREYGECKYTAKFNDDHSITLLGFEGEEGNRGEGAIEYEKGIKAAAAAKHTFKNSNALFRMVTQREYPRLPLQKFFEGGQVEEVPAKTAKAPAAKAAAPAPAKAPAAKAAAPAKAPAKK